MYSLLYIFCMRYVGKEMINMLSMLLLAFILVYTNCWRKEIKEFRHEKDEKAIKEIRKHINIDVQ